MRENNDDERTAQAMKYLKEHGLIRKLNQEDVTYIEAQLPHFIKKREQKLASKLDPHRKRRFRRKKNQESGLQISVAGGQSNMEKKIKDTLSSYSLEEGSVSLLSLENLDKMVDVEGMSELFSNRISNSSDRISSLSEAESGEIIGL